MSFLSQLRLDTSQKSLLQALSYATLFTGACILEKNSNGIISFLKDMLIITIHVNTYSVVQQVDKFVLERCISRTRSLNVSEPGNGYHILVCWTLMMFHRQCHGRSDVEYTIYAVRDADLTWLRSRISTQSSISVHKMVSLNSYDHHIVEVPVTISDGSIDEYPYQTNLLDTLMATHNDRARLVLICGEPYTGKSSIARLLYMRFAQKGVVPFLLEGFNPKNPGLSFVKHVLGYSRPRNVPIIILLDEIDKAMEYTRGERQETSNSISHAQDKTEFCNFLDLLRDIPGLIMIGTSNVELDQLLADYPEYLRKGRIEIHATFIRSDADNTPGE